MPDTAWHPLATAFSTLRKARNAIRGGFLYSPPVNWIRYQGNRWLGDPADVPFHWLKQPQDLAGRHACLFVTYSRAGLIAPHVYLHARAWAKEGYHPVLIVVLDEISDFDADQDIGPFAGVMLRQNVGYDFGAWATGIRALPSLRNAESLVTVNDSVYGPLNGFSEMVARIRTSNADVVGLTESFEGCRHFQSYVISFNAKALRSQTFWEFWGQVRLGGRQHVIRNYELTLANRMDSGGLTTQAIFPAQPKHYGNPTHRDWRRLIENGFPYIKAELVRDNPDGFDISDWRTVVSNRGFDPALIEGQLAPRKPSFVRDMRRATLRWARARLGE